MFGGEAGEIAARGIREHRIVNQLDEPDQTGHRQGGGGVEQEERGHEKLGGVVAAAGFRGQCLGGPDRPQYLELVDLHTSIYCATLPLTIQDGLEIRPEQISDETARGRNA